MSNLNAMRCTFGPTDACWQLQTIEGGRHTGLLEWVANRDDLDGEVPPEAIGIIVRALGRSFRVTFHYPLPESTSPVWEFVDGEWRCIVRPPGLAKLFRKAIPLVSTTIPERAQKLFDAAPFNWALQGQIVLISSADLPPPALAYWQMDQIWRARRRDPERLGLLPNIVGMMFPAVDGDFVQFVAFDDPFWFQFLDGLQAECRSAGVEWRVVDEADFKRRPWFVERRCVE